MYASYISDGYTEHGFIKDMPGLHQALRFDFRPMTVADRDDWQSITDGEVPAEQAKITSRVISKKIIKWNLKDHQGQPIPVSSDAITRLKPALYVRLVAIISGSGPSDTDVDVLSGDPDDLKAQAEARLLGGAERLANDQKNSLAG